MELLLALVLVLVLVLLLELYRYRKTSSIANAFADLGFCLNLAVNRRCPFEGSCHSGDSSERLLHVLPESTEGS